MPWFKCLWIFISAISFAFALLLTRELFETTFPRKPPIFHACHRAQQSSFAVFSFLVLVNLVSPVVDDFLRSSIISGIIDACLLIFLSLSLRWCCRLSPGGMTVVVVNTSLRLASSLLSLFSVPSPIGVNSVLSLVKRCPFKSGGFVDSLFVWTLFYNTWEKAFDPIHRCCERMCADVYGVLVSGFRSCLDSNNNNKK